MIYKMKYFGSATGKSGMTYHFDKDQQVEAPTGEFSKEVADEVKPVKEKK